MVPKLKMPFLSCYNYLCYPDPDRNESSALTAVCLHWVTARTRRVVRWDMSSLEDPTLASRHCEHLQ